MGKFSALHAVALCMVFMSGCASVTEHLNRSMQDTYIASEVCRVVNDVVEVRSADIKADIQDMAESLLGLSVCTSAQGDQTDCPKTLHALVADLDDEIHAALSVARQHRAAHEKRIADLQALIRQTSEHSLNLRGDIRTALEEVKDSFNGACKSPDQCARDYRNFVLKIIQVTDRRFFEISSDVKKINREVETLVAALNADLKTGRIEIEKLDRTLKLLSAGIDRRWEVARKLVSNEKWRQLLTDVAHKIGLQEAGRLTVRMLEKGTQSVDRVLDRVDEKAWFVASLAMAVYETAIRDELKAHFQKYYGKFDAMERNDPLLFRNLSAAFVFASCEQLAIPSGDPGKASTPATGRGAYLLYPLFSAAVGGLYAHLVPDAGGAEINSDEFRMKLVEWIGTKEGRNNLTEVAKLASVPKAILIAKTNEVQVAASLEVKATAVQRTLSRSLASLPVPPPAKPKPQAKLAPKGAAVPAKVAPVAPVAIELPKRESVETAVDAAIEKTLR